MEFNTNTQGLNAKANAGLATGIVGSALGAINTLGNAGGLAGLLGLNTPAPAPANIPGTFPGYIPTMQVDPCVNRYELGLQQQIAAKDSQIALRDANTYVDQKLLQLYQYIDGRNREQDAINTQQAVLNQANKDSFQMVSDRLICVKNELEGQIKAEKAARCCADNAIVNYVNATFYPKLVADVTAGTTTTAQTLYNPLPACESACCNN